VSTAAIEVTNNLRFLSAGIDKKVSAEQTASDMAALLQAVASHRNRDAFQQIFHHFAPQVKAFLINRGLSHAAADDVLQEVMLGIWNKAGSYDPAKAKVSTWIFTIARYKYIDRLRHEGRRPTEAGDFDLHEADSEQSDDGVFQAQSQDAVKAAIAHLPEDQKTVIFLSFVKGLSHSEVAEQLTLPLGTVKSRIRRAFAQLRVELSDLQPALSA
jgi:RNA polymerase sigma-70 factor (ECF subfamily)